VRFVQSENAMSPIDVTPSDRVTLEIKSR
jgi:hypothetical protein